VLMPVRRGRHRPAGRWDRSAEQWVPAFARTAEVPRAARADRGTVDARPLGAHGGDVKEMAQGGEWRSAPEATAHLRARMERSSRNVGRIGCGKTGADTKPPPVEFAPDSPLEGTRFELPVRAGGLFRSEPDRSPICQPFPKWTSNAPPLLPVGPPLSPRI